MARRHSAWLAATFLLGCAHLGAQTARPALPSGNRIPAQDGDTIVVDNDARVRIIRRREATVRVVHNRAEQWLLLLVDHAAEGAGPDGRVEASYYYTGLSDWPMEERWEGTATVEEYTIAGGPWSGIGFAGPRGLVQILPPAREDSFRDPDGVAVLSFSGSSGSRRTDGRGMTFDEAEREQVIEIRRNAARQGHAPGVGVASTTASGVFTELSIAPSDPRGAIRVGGGVRPPAKIVDARPVVPEQVLRAGIKGVVILEVTIDTEGAVKDARVLRSIPLLDQAALDAVRQWRFTPTTLDGQPVPVIMTVTVPFP
ncbi:MAG TPA: energy transducer TonB [Vicinamibacterales bacterium]|nr:energy transducer TonB [Vicinamibacterales bacterium]